MWNSFPYILYIHMDISCLLNLPFGLGRKNDLLAEYIRLLCRKVTAHERKGEGSSAERISQTCGKEAASAKNTGVETGRISALFFYQFKPDS